MSDTTIDPIHAAGFQSKTIPISLVRESSKNPRRHFDQTKLTELAESIRKHGIITPIMVRRTPQPHSHVEDYEIAAGHRRYPAIRHCGGSRRTEGQPSGGVANSACPAVPQPAVRLGAHRTLGGDFAMTNTDFRAALEAWAARLRSILANRKPILVERAADLTDNISQRIQREIAATTSNRENALLRQIERAIAKLDTPLWGLCEECGDPIPAKRLAAVPYAERCRDCQELAEMEASAEAAQATGVGVL